jgi:cell division protein ZipA
MSLRTVLLIIAVFFSVGIVFANYHRKRNQRRITVAKDPYFLDNEAQEVTASDGTNDARVCTPVPTIPSEIKSMVEPMAIPRIESQQKEKVPMVVFYIMAKNEGKFTGFDLLQCLTRYGLSHGPLGIFDYIDRSQRKNELLFSVASASEPGQFDIDKMGSAFFSGICLFMNFNSRDPVQAFKKMLTTIQLLLTDLSGELFDDQYHPCNQHYLTVCHRRILEHKAAQITDVAAACVSTS